MSGKRSKKKRVSYAWIHEKIARQRENRKAFWREHEKLKAETPKLLAEGHHPLCIYTLVTMGKCNCAWYAAEKVKEENRLAERERGFQERERKRNEKNAS